MSLGLTTGDVIDGFTVGPRLHAGGMGVIFRCSPPPDRPDLDFPLLIKVPRLGPGEPSESVVTYEVEVIEIDSARDPRLVIPVEQKLSNFHQIQRVDGLGVGGSRRRSSSPQPGSSSRIRCPPSPPRRGARC